MSDRIMNSNKNEKIISKELIKVKTNTGVIFVDQDKKLEFLYVGDYQKENNIKADFLGLKKEIKTVKHQEVDLRYKIVITISTQKGCPMKCKFCDVPLYKYSGNISKEDLIYQIKTACLEIIKDTGITHTQRLNIHFARMGEPSFNQNVIEVCKELPFLDLGITYDTIHPVFTTMCPKGNKELEKRLIEFALLKNELYKGEAGIQFSINTTNDKDRNKAFSNCSLSLKEISEIAKKLPKPKGRKYTLNAAVDENTIIDPKILSSLFDKENFIVKLTPIHETKSAITNGFGIIKDNWDIYNKIEQPLLKEGWDVIVFVPSREEDEDRITCGNLLLKNYKK